jgi:hypothetical protein
MVQAAQDRHGLYDTRGRASGQCRGQLVLHQRSPVCYYQGAGHGGRLWTRCPQASISEQAVQRWETGQGSPSAARLPALLTLYLKTVQADEGCPGWTVAVLRHRGRLMGLPTAAEHRLIAYMIERRANERRADRVDGSGAGRGRAGGLARHRGAGDGAGDAHDHAGTGSADARGVLEFGAKGLRLARDNAHAPPRNRPRPEPLGAASRSATPPGRTTSGACARRRPSWSRRGISWRRTSHPSSSGRRCGGTCLWGHPSPGKRQRGEPPIRRGLVSGSGC